METIKIIYKKDYAILQFQRGKVNAFNQLMVDEIRTTVKEVQNDDAIKGLIITGTPHFLSAGLDVVELYHYDKPAISKFMVDFIQMHIDLVEFTKPLVCAINGHAPAGGTVVAIAADYRIMVDGEKYVMGLNEIKVNIPLGKTFIDAYSFWLGKSKAYEFLLDGKLLNPKEALAEGLINELVTAEDLLPRAEQKMKQYLQAEPEIFRSIKSALRQDWIASIEEVTAEALAHALEIWWSPSIRGKLKMFVEQLTKKAV